MKANEHLLEVKHLSKQFSIKKGFLGSKTSQVYAVNQVSFTIKKGETLGLVGESGCGKTTLGRMLAGLIQPSAGQIFFDGVDITCLDTQAMKAMRRKMQIIFQDPYAALNPRMTIRSILAEPLKIHHLCKTTEECNKRIDELLDYVQLPKDTLHKYPHEFSGGQRQRICIARALAVEPQFIVFDEPVSALDVSVQAQVINLLMELQNQLQLTYFFISHNLNIVEFVAHRVAVMYLGNIVEMAAAHDIYKKHQHPYTEALLSAIPNPVPQQKTNRIILKGDLPSPMSPPAGCHFHPRCWKATAECQKQYPAITTIAGEHLFRCYHPAGKK